MHGSTCQSHDLARGVGSNSCVSDVTFLEAHDICAASGLRLCSLEEMQGGECCGTGCTHNHHAMWVRVVGSTVDGCERDGNNEHPLTAHEDETHTADVRCCSMDGSTCESQNLEGGVDCLRNGNVHSEGCVFDKTLVEAHEICSASGMRLCAPDEVDACCSTGCWHNHHAIWVAPRGHGILLLR